MRKGSGPRNHADYSLPAVLDMNTATIGGNKALDPRQIPLSNNAVVLNTGSGPSAPAPVAQPSQVIKEGQHRGSVASSTAAEQVQQIASVSFSNSKIPAHVVATAAASPKDNITSAVTAHGASSPTSVSVRTVKGNKDKVPTMLRDEERGVTIGVQTSFYKYDQAKEAKELD